MEWLKRRSYLKSCNRIDMKRKNILFAYITPFHPNKGGIGRVTHQLTLELQRRGYNVFYLIYPSGITIRHEYDYPAPLEYLPSSDLLSEENIVFYHNYLKRNNISIVVNQSGNFDDSRLWLKAKEWEVKVISVLHSTPWVAYKHLWQEIYPLRNNSKIEKIKRVARIVLYPRIKYRSRKSRIEHYKMLLPSTDCVCTLSKKYFSEISEIYPGYEYKYRAIPNPNSYKSKEIDRLLVPKKKQVLWVGLFCTEKNPTLAIRIWRRLYRDYPDWEFVIVGYNKNGFWQERMEYLAQGMPNIRFVGYQDPLPYQLESSISCMTSLYEGWGMVLTEAMQCGAVPIAFNSFASATDIIDHGRNGILVKPFSIKQYEKELRRLMDNLDLLKRLSENAMQDIKKYNVDCVVDQWEELFQEFNNG